MFIFLLYLSHLNHSHLLGHCWSSESSTDVSGSPAFCLFSFQWLLNPPAMSAPSGSRALWSATASGIVRMARMSRTALRVRRSPLSSALLPIGFFQDKIEIPLLVQGYHLVPVFPLKIPGPRMEELITLTGMDSGCMCVCVCVCMSVWILEDFPCLLAFNAFMTEGCWDLI